MTHHWDDDGMLHDDAHDTTGETALPAAHQAAAGAYNAPPAAVPHDAMWAAIQARRATRTEPDRAPPATGLSVAHTTRARAPRPWRDGSVVALAAAALLALVVVRPTIRTPVRATAVAAATDTTVNPTAWQVVSTEHFGAAESMLSALATTKPEESDRQLMAWSRDLLESTRLLMDSPAGRDPKRRALLLDLELVLVQLVESGPAMRTEDRTVMDDLLSRSAVLLTRLRTTIPAGAPASRH